MREKWQTAKMSMWSSTLFAGLLTLSCATSPQSGSTSSSSPHSSSQTGTGNTGAGNTEEQLWSAQELAAAVRISNEQVEIGSVSVSLRPSETPYKIQEVPAELDKLNSGDTEVFDFVVKDDVKALQLLSVLKSAAFGGHENSRLQSTKTTLHMQGDDKSEKPQAGDWERWRGPPLHVEIRSDTIRVSRIRLTDAEEGNAAELKLGSDDTAQLEHALNKWCPPSDPIHSAQGEEQAPDPCSPFLLTLEHAAPVASLKGVLMALDAWAAEQPRQAHALVLLHGAKEAQKIAENIADRGTLQHGHIAPDRVKDVMHGASKEFDRCFQEGKKRGLDLSGIVQLRLRIEETGAVTNVKALDESTLTDPNLQKCVMDVAAHLTFPKPVKGAVNITYPIRARY